MKTSVKNSFVMHQLSTSLLMTEITVGSQKTQQFKDPLLRGREILELLLG